MSGRTDSPATLLEVSVSVAGTPWRRVDSFHAEAPAAGTFALHIDETGAAHVVFGNGVHGQRPPAGAAIQVTYGAGGGRTGQVSRNAPLSGGVSGLVVPLPIKPVEVSWREVRRRWPPW